jgi:hypothetical protein
LCRKNQRKATDPGCKTSIPGSNPGGASNLFGPDPLDVNTNVNTQDVRFC